MKKIAISLIALAAVSMVAFANENRGDIRDSDTYVGKFSNQVMNRSVGTSALVVIKSDAGQFQTNFERMKKISEENETSGH
jgi:hypothetical protein